MLTLTKDIANGSVAGHAPLVVTEVRSPEAFAALRSEWNALAASSIAPSIFGTWEWAWHWLMHFGSNSSHGMSHVSLRILVLRDSRGTCVGLAPFYSRAGACDHAQRSTPRLITAKAGQRILSTEWRQIGDLGRDGEGMTDEPALLLKSGYEAQALRTLLDYLGSEKASEWDTLKLRFQTPDRMRDTGDGSPCRGLKAQYRQGNGSEIVDLDGSWPEFRSGLSRSMRDNIAYYPRLLDRRGFSWSFEIARSRPGVRQSVDALIDLHRQRADFRRGNRHFSHIPMDIHADFLRSTLAELASEGLASVGLLLVDGVPVAAQAFLEFERRLVFYYSGFCEEYYDYSPLTILAARVLEDAHRRGIRCVNFLPGPEPWKTRWGARSSTVVEEITYQRLQAKSIARIAMRAVARECSQRLGRT